MKRPLHLLIVGSVLSLIGGYKSLELIGVEDLTRLGLLLFLPMLMTGCLLVLAYILGPLVLKRFKAAELYALSFGLSLLILLPLLVLGII